MLERLGSRRLWYSSRPTNIVPKFEPAAFSANDWPLMPVTCRTPGVESTIFSMRRTTAAVRSSEAESGNCTLISR